MTEVISEERKREASQQLKQVCDRGLEAEREFITEERNFYALQAKIDELGSKADVLRDQITEAEAPGQGFQGFQRFQSHAAVDEKQLAKLRERWASIILERSNLQARLAASRTTCIRLDNEITALRRAQRNLEMLAEGKNPAEATGSVNRVAFGGYNQVL